jgi:hypothetical protein
MKTGVKNPFLVPVLIAGLGLLQSGGVVAQTFTTLHSFTATLGNAGFFLDGMAVSPAAS